MIDKYLSCFALIKRTALFLMLPFSLATIHVKTKFPFCILEGGQFVFAVTFTKHTALQRKVK